MATERSDVTTFEANGDLSSHQFKFVKLVTGGKVALNDSATANGIPGVLYNKPSAAGMAAEVAVGPIVKVKLNDTLAVGEYINSDATGLGVKVTADKARYFCIANEAGVAGDVIETTWVGQSFLSV